MAKTLRDIIEKLQTELNELVALADKLDANLGTKGAVQDDERAVTDIAHLVEGSTKVRILVEFDNIVDDTFKPGVYFVEGLDLGSQHDAYLADPETPANNPCWVDLGQLIHNNAVVYA